MPEAPVVEAEKVGLTEEDKGKIKTALESLYSLWEEGKLPGYIIATLGRLVGYPLPEGIEAYPYPSKYQYPGPYQYPSPYPKPYPKAEGATETAPDLREATATEQTEKNQEEVKVVDKAEQAEQEVLKKAAEEIEALKKALEEERMIRLKKEFTENLKAKIPSLLAVEPRLADILFDVKKSGNEEVASVFEKLEAIVAASPLFKELGASAQPPAESPWDIVEKEARQLLEKGEARTLEAARVMVLTKNRDLYERLRWG